MPIEPVALPDFFLSFFTAALIIVCATLYAALFAWGKLSGRRGALWAAAVAYLALLVSVTVFSQINHFSGYWLLLSVLMLLGYAFAPVMIWHLCDVSHRHE